MDTKLTREELIELGRKIINCEGTEEEVDKMYDLFNQNVPYPDGANLFYWPENHDMRKDDISNYSPTVEEVVDKCLAYRPIQI